MHEREIRHKRPSLKNFTSNHSYFVILSPLYASEDTTAPIVTCPADITTTVQVGTTSVSVTYADATATDNSGTVALVGRTHTSGSSFPIGDTTVTYTFADASGNSASCNFTISVLVTSKLSVLKIFENVFTTIRRTV